MLVCFGAAWPASIYKSYVSRQTAGKSILFLWIIFTGYFFGIIHKLIFSYDLVIYLYVINGVMIMADIILYYRNRKLNNPEEVKGDSFGRRK